MREFFIGFIGQTFGRDYLATNGETPRAESMAKFEAWLSTRDDDDNRIAMVAFTDVTRLPSGALAPGGKNYP